MKTVEIRNKLIAQIRLSSNNSLMEEMYNLLNIDNEVDVYELNNEQKAAILEARQQIKDGQFFTNDQVNEEITKWLDEKQSGH